MTIAASTEHEREIPEMGKKDHLQDKRKNTHLWTIFDRLYYFKENNYRGYLLILFIIMNILLFTVLF